MDPQTIEAIKSFSTNKIFLQIADLAPIVVAKNIYALMIIMAVWKVCAVFSPWAFDNKMWDFANGLIKLILSGSCTPVRFASFIESRANAYKNKKGDNTAYESNTYEPEPFWASSKKR